MTIFDLLTTILAPTGIGVALIKLITVIVSRKRAARLSGGFSSIEELFTEIQQLLRITQAGRVLVLKSENGGGVPAPGCVVRNSVIYEVFDPCSRRLSPVWQNIELDTDYARVISELFSTKGESTLRKSDVNEASLLFDLMQVGDFNYVKFVRVCATSRSLVYLAVCYGANTESAPHHRLEILRVARTLCRIFNAHHDLVKGAE